MTEPSPYAAFVDESGSDRVRDPGTYILSAAVIAPEAFDHIRLVMRDLALEHLVVVRHNAANDRETPGPVVRQDLLGFTSKSTAADRHYVKYATSRDSPTTSETRPCPGVAAPPQGAIPLTGTTRLTASL